MLNKKLKRALCRMVKEGTFNPRRRDPVVVRRQSAALECATNADYRRTLDKYTVDGKLGVVKSGMDCDCTQYYREYVMDAPRTVAEFKRWDAARVDALDGPESVYFCRPEEVEPQHRSLDLALRAYEDGHAHVVYPVGYEELVPQ